MKTINLDKTFYLLGVIILTFVFFLTGCSKQDNKETSANKEQKTETSQQQKTIDNSQHDTSINMNHDNMDMNHNNMDMNHNNMDMDKDSKSEKDEEITHSHIHIPTAQCDKCKKNLEEVLNKVLGLKSFEVDIDLHKVHIYYDKKVTNISKIEEAITAAGYDANNKKADPDAYSKLDDCCKRPQDRKKK